MTAVGVVRGRDERLDGWRGIAVVSMMLDHVALVLAGLGVPGPWDLLRLTAGRVAFPVFLVVSGAVYAMRGARGRRLLEVAACGLFVSAVCVLAGLPIGRPDILLLIAAGLAAMPVFVRWPLLALCLGVIQPFTWPVPWSGYQPGAVVVLLLIGYWVMADEGYYVTGPVTLRWVSTPAWWEWLGRSALSVYVAHLVVLAVLFGGVMWAR